MPPLLHKQSLIGPAHPILHGFDRQRYGSTGPASVLSAAYRYYSGALIIARSRSVFSGVHPGGCRTAAHAFTTSLT